MELRTEVEILAPAAAVWRILTHTDEYPRWNPLIARIDGELKAGEQIAVAFYKGDGSHRLLRHQVEEVEPERRLSWSGHLWLPGLYDGSHIFDLHPSRLGGTHLCHTAQFDGLLLPLIRHKLRTETLPLLRAMSRMVKERAETAAL